MCLITYVTVLVDVFTMSFPYLLSLHAIYYNCLVCLLFFLAMSCNFFANTKTHVIYILYFFQVCFLFLQFTIVQYNLFFSSLQFFVTSLDTPKCVSFTFVVVLSSFQYFSLLALRNFLVHVFFFPCNCFATSLQIPRCVTSTSIVVLLNVFGLSSFLVDKNYYTFQFLHMQQKKFKR